MNRLPHLQLGKRQLWLMASSLAFQLLTVSSEAQIVTLTHNNSVAQINTGGQAGMFNWSVDGTNQLSQQWFWYRVGAVVGESSINTISAPSITTPDARTLYLNYNNGSYGVEVDYLLTGCSAKSGMSAIQEMISITNATASALDFHFFEYADFDAAGTAGNDVVQLGKNLGGLFNETRQSENPISIEVVATPGANHGEAALFNATLVNFNNANPDSLNDNAGPVGPGDATSALQWDLNIPPGSSVVIGKDFYLQARQTSPLLTITRTMTNTVAVSWPSSSTGFSLQQNTNGVSSVNWSNAPGTIQDDGTTKTLIVNPPAGNRFYRLKTNIL